MVHTRCSTCPIRHRAVCSYSDPIQLAELDSVKFYRDFEPGQELVGEGETARWLGSIVTGVVALQKTMEDGRRQMVGMQFASDFIGRPFRGSAPFEAVAITPVRMCLFHRAKFEEILGRHKGLERRLLEMTLDELDAAREWMVLLGRKTARERLASFLMILARRAAMLEKVSLRDGVEFAIPLTREAISEFLGLTIETVSRQITALKRAGVIDLPDKRSVTVVDLAALMSLSGDDGDDALDSVSA